MSPTAKQWIQNVVVGFCGALLIFAWYRILSSLVLWPENDMAVTMLGEWLFLQRNSVASTFSGLAVLSISVAGLVVTPVWKLRVVRVVIAVSILAFPAVMIILCWVRTTPAA